MCRNIWLFLIYLWIHIIKLAIKFIFVKYDLGVPLWIINYPKLYFTPTKTQRLLMNFFEL